MKLKHTTQQPLNTKWMRTLNKGGKSIKHKWVKLTFYGFVISTILKYFLLNIILYTIISK